MAHTFKVEDRYRTEGDWYRANRVNRKRAIEQARCENMSDRRRNRDWDR